MGRPTSSKTSVQAPLALHQLSGEILSAADLEGERWYDCAPEWPAPGKGGVRGKMGQWREVAAAALASASKTYEKRVGSGEGAGTRALAKEKTIGDKIAALTLLVQESPLHRLDELRTLLEFAKKKHRRESGPAIEAMKDLFVNDLLPGDRRLVRFEDREFDCPKQSISKRNVAYALFEDELKTVYREFLEVLEESGKDNLAHFKQKAVKQIFELLVAKPEHEKELLSMLVNKLGDPDRKVSSTASYNLSKLIEKHHPQMRLIVIREVEQLVTRPNVTMKTQYFAVGFLTQIRLSGNDVELARRLLRIYMDLFTACLAHEKEAPKRGKVEPAKLRKKKKRKRMRELQKAPAVPKPDISVALKETRLMGALLMGANRAYPFTKPEQDDTSYEEHYNALFSVAHAHALGPATQALAFLFQVSQSHSTQSDRFYKALYSRILDAAEAGEPKQAQFLNLLYRSMDADTDPRRVKAFAKRLLQAASSGSAAFAGACVIVLSECYKGRHRGILRSFISLSERFDEEETFVDADKSGSSMLDSERKSEDEADQVSVESPEESGADDTKVNGQSAVRNKDQSEQTTPTQEYDLQKRDPQFAGAERSSLWELAAVCSHFHPSVSLFAKTICVSLNNVQFRSDPLKDFSLISFLDRFVYKKPKNRVAKSLYGKRSAHYRTDPLANSESFQQLAKEGNVGADDEFLVRFFDANPNRIVREKDDSDVQGSQDGADFAADSEEEAFEQAMKAEMQRLGADAGFVSTGIKNHLADVDEEDPDELKAFEKAFENEMVASGDEAHDAERQLEPIDKSDEEDDTVVPLQTYEDSENEESSEGDEVEQQPAKRQKKGQGEKEVASRVFAAAEDYAEAIDKDVMENRLNEHDAVDGLPKNSSQIASAKTKKYDTIRKLAQRKRKSRAVAHGS